MELKFRTLKASEIDCRLSQVSKETGTGTFLLYKDARVDMSLLDEVVGPMDWKREHTRDNANCIVSIWDSEKNQWISKEDTGTESYTEKEKGLASDSFKRACVNWGIGRELYTAPTIWVNPLQGEDIKKLKLKCTKIDYNEQREISMLELVDRKGNVRFRFGQVKDVPAVLKAIKDATTIEQLQKIQDAVKQRGVYAMEIKEGGMIYNAIMNRMSDLQK